MKMKKIVLDEYEKQLEKEKKKLEEAAKNYFKLKKTGKLKLSA